MTWKFEVVRKCRDKFSLTFKHIREAAEKSKIQNIHKLCKVNFDESNKHDIIKCLLFFFCHFYISPYCIDFNSCI